MSDTIFPRCMREGKKIDVNMWSLAEAVLAESDGKLVGRRGIKALSEDFQNLCGLDYSTSWLNDLRFVAQQFPRSRRYDGEHNKPIVSVKAHLAAEDPDNLDAIVKAAKKEGAAVTSKFVQHMTVFFRQEEFRVRKHEHEEAKRDVTRASKEFDRAAARQRAAKNDHEREEAQRDRDSAEKHKKDAQQRARETRPMPRGQVKAPTDETVLSVSVLVASLKVKAAEAKGLAKGARKELGDRIGYLSENQAALLHEVAMEAAEALRKLAQDIQSSTDKKSSHLSVVA